MVEDSSVCPRIIARNPPLRKTIAACPLRTVFGVGIDQIDERSVAPIGVVEVEVLYHEAGAVLQKTIPEIFESTTAARTLR